MVDRYPCGLGSIGSMMLYKEYDLYAAISNSF